MVKRTMCEGWLVRTLAVGSVTLSAVILGSATQALAVPADWAEEMNAAPQGWDSYGTQSLVQVGTGTWRLNHVVAYGTAPNTPTPNPAAGLLDYTVEYRARLTAPLDEYQGGNPGRWWPIYVYMSDATQSMNRASVGYGVENGNRNWFGVDKPYSEGRGPDPALAPDQWAVFRFINEASQNQIRIYVDGVHLHTFPAGGSVLNGPDDPFIFGSQEASSAVDSEWDYLRIARRVVPIDQPLDPVSIPGCPGNLNGDGTTDGADVAIIYNAWGTNDATADIDDSGTVDGADLAEVFNCWGQADTSPAAVPEPASFGLLGLGLLGLLTRARR